MAAPKSLLDKIWDTHTVDVNDDNITLLYIDRHLVHEVTSPQAFESLRLQNRKVRRPNACLAVADHNVPTLNRAQGIKDATSRLQVETLEQNCQEFGLHYFPLLDTRQGIVHVVGPEQGFTLPGMTIACGDSHTSTHGAFGSLAFGIGTSEVEHILATQTLPQTRPKSMRIHFKGKTAPWIEAKDMALAMIGKIGTSGGTGYAIEYTGEAVKVLSMEGRMTLCNMTIEAGAKAGFVAPDQKTIDYIKGRPLAPKGEDWHKAVEYWHSLSSDEGAHFDKEITINVNEITPQITWGTSPQDVLPITASVPDPTTIADEHQRVATERAIDYMGLTAGMALTDISVDTVFIGSCTNGRIEDLRVVASIVKGKHVASTVQGLIVPGSGLVKAQAEEEGLDQIFLDAGFEWREPGCSMCLAMNDDRLQAGERCASTSNRNFEGRQGRGGRTHLMSPSMAAAAAITGHLTDIRSLSV